MKKIKALYHFLVYLKRLINKDRLRTFPVKLIDKFNCWRKGFLPESFIIYNFKYNKKSSYLSDLKRLTKAAMINKNSLLIDDKYMFANYFKDDRAVQPQYYISNRIRQEFKTKKMVSKESLISCLKLNTNYVFKTVGGGGGKGISFLSYSNNKWNLDGNILNDDAFAEALELFRNTIICPKIVQNGFCAELYPESLNTMRVLTMIDPISQKSFIASAVLRCGSKETKGLDNWSSGGLSMNIDLETGILSKAVAFPKKGALVWYGKHPDTGFKIEGFIIPNWKSVKNEILKIADKHFYLPYVGWDVILQENDFSILEANGNSDVNLLQVHEPLLDKPRVKSFYKYYSVVNG